MKTIRVWGLCLCVLMLAACNFNRVDVQRTGDIVILTVTVTESEVNQTIGQILGQAANPLLWNPTVDLQPMGIVIHGEHDRRDGNGRVAGDMTLTLGMNGGVIAAQVISVNIEGVDISDARIQALNQQLSANLSQRAGRRVVTITSIALTDNDLTITFQATRN